MAAIGDQVLDQLNARGLVLDHKPPPSGAGDCWYGPAKLYSPIVRRIWSRVSSGLAVWVQSPDAA
jgi:hypothetical protein